MSEQRVFSPRWVGCYWSFPSFLLIILFLQSTLCAAELRWRFEKGQTLSFKLEQQTQVDSQLGPRNTNLAHATEMEILWHIDEIADDGSAQITQKFERLAMKLQLPKLAPIVFDTASTAKPAGDAKVIAETVAPLLEVSIKANVTHRGELTSVELDEAGSKVVEAIAANPTLKLIGSREGLVRMLKQSLLLLPAESVEPGATWEKSDEVSSPLGEFKQTTTFKLLEPEASEVTVARIEAISKLEPGAKSTNPSQKPDLEEQEQSSLFLFDTKAGRLLSSETSQKFVTRKTVKESVVRVKLTSTSKTTVEVR